MDEAKCLQGQHLLTPKAFCFLIARTCVAGDFAVNVILFYYYGFARAPC